MVIPSFLAMTKAEIRANPDVSSPIAWMACHFSPYATGLSNLPEALPEGSMLILNDRTPWWKHDPELIVRQLSRVTETLGCHGLLLDFQRPGIEEVAALSRLLVDRLPCPVGVSEAYAQGLSCPVFLPPLPLEQQIPDYLSPWKDREIWLEAALNQEEILLTEEGALVTPLPLLPDTQNFHPDEKLHCHYRVRVEENSAVFYLLRTREDLEPLLEEAADYGVTTAVGLWQELS